MDIEHEELNHSSNESSSLPSDLSWSTSSSNTNYQMKKSFFNVIDTNISIDTEINAIINIWVNVFEKNPKTGTLQLFTIVMNCLDIDVCESSFTNFNSIIMFRKITKWLKIMEEAGSLLSPETIKKSSDVQKTLQFVYSIFHCHSNLFFSNETHKSYFIFLTDILIKLSQCDFIGPRLLATELGLKILTGLIKSSYLKIVLNDFNLLLNEFFVKRWKDTSFIVREAVLLELKLWIQIDSIYFLNDFWKYIYWALGDRSTSIQIIALKLSKTILDMHSYVTTVKLLVKKIINVLPNLLLSKNNEVVILAFSLYSTLSSVVEDDEEQYLSTIESIAFELIFSENSSIARFTAKYFMDAMVNSQTDKFEQLKVVLLILRGIPSEMTTVAISFFTNAIYDFCPLLTDFKLISQVLSLENSIEDRDKHNLMHVLMYVVKWLVTGIEPEHKIAIMGDQNDIVQSHTNKFKKKEFTSYLSMHLINELKNCKEPTYAFSIWTLIQFIDFKLLQDKMILSEIFLHASLFYNAWSIPTLLEIISKFINIISDIDGFEQNLSLKCIKDIAEINFNILRTGVEASPGDIPSLLSQKNALIKIWTLAKYNSIPDDIEPLKYLSYYIPDLNNTHNDLIISNFALMAYMEILRNKLLKVPIVQNMNLNNQVFENNVEDTFATFIGSMFNILSKYDIQLISICETAFLIINELLQIKFSIYQKKYELDDNQNMMLTHFVLCVCKNCEGNNDLNTLKIVKVYIQLIQEGLINMNHLINLLQFVKMELFEHALRPLFNFFCKKETGNELSNVINLYLVYTFENIILQKPDFKNSTIKDVINVAVIISRLLCQCTDQSGKRLIATNIHRRGIQYAMSDTLNNPYSDYPFKQFFWILTSMYQILIPYDAQRLADHLLDKPTTQKLINSENEHILNYLYKLQEVYNTDEN
uniref:SCD domain-containing protein n=1 Tax=Sipha flava TaxID=143950 RepID=A0A2S2Q4J1_9HEMI